jgi:hypothetical protein
MTLPGDNQTPVYVAAKMGYVSMLEVLMLSGASMTAGAGTDCATTPFHAAACSLDNFEAAKFLADNGARTALTDEEVPNSFEELKQLCDEGRQSIVESVVKLNPQLLHAYTKEMVELERMLKAVSKVEPVARSILQCLQKASAGKTLQTCTEVQQNLTEPSDFVDATQATKALVAACTLVGASVGGCCTTNPSSNLM